MRKIKRKKEARKMINSDTRKKLGIAGVLTLGALGYIFLSKPSHDYDVDSKLIVQSASYESCLKVSYGVIDDTNISERESDARACLDAINNKEFFVDVDGNALIFVNSNDYYRISPKVIEVFKSKSNALLDKNVIGTAEVTESDAF